MKNQPSAPPIVYAVPANLPPNAPYVAPTQYFNSDSTPAPVPAINNNPQLYYGATVSTAPVNSVPRLFPQSSAASTYGYYDAVANNWLRVGGLISFAQLVLGITLCTKAGAGAQIGTIICSFVVCIVSFVGSFCCFNVAHCDKVRAIVSTVFSVISLACAIGAYVTYAYLEACAVPSLADDQTYTFYGNSAYYPEAAVCANDDSNIFDWCSCVNSSNDNCLTVSFRTYCQPILDGGPKFSKALLAVSVISTFVICVAVTIAFLWGGQSASVPLLSEEQRAAGSAYNNSTTAPVQQPQYMQSYPPEPSVPEMDNTNYKPATAPIYATAVN